MSKAGQHTVKWLEHQFNPKDITQVFIKIKQVKNLQDFLCQIFTTLPKLKVIEVLIKLIPHILLKGLQLSLLVKNL